MMGTTRRLKEHTRAIRCIAVQPADALHGLEGLKHLPSSLVPAIYDDKRPDETMWIDTEDGWDMADRLAREEGLHVGHSSGANVFAAREDRREAPPRARGRLRGDHHLRSRRSLLCAHEMGEEVRVVTTSSRR